MPRHELEVADEYAGERLDRYLAAVLPGHSRSQLQRLIKEGLVEVGGRPGTCERAGQDRRPHRARRARARARPSAEPEDLPLDVIYEDDRPHRGEQGGRDGGPSGGRAPRRNAGQRAAPPRGRSERRRRRAAAGHRAPARPRHVGRDGGGQARPLTRGARATVPGSRGREGIRRARLGCRAGGTAHRPPDRARPERPAEDVVPRDDDPASRGRRGSPARTIFAA